MEAADQTRQELSAALLKFRAGLQDYGRQLQLCAEVATPPAAATPPNSLGNARALCAKFNGISELRSTMTDECKVSWWYDTVSITMNISPEAADTFCRAAVEKLRDTQLRFEPGWQLKIYSPYSGDRSIAFCDLPQ